MKIQPSISRFAVRALISGMGLLIWALPCFEARGQPLELAAEIIGTARGNRITDQRDVVWVGNHVYTGGANTASGGALAIWDVSNPRVPILLAEEGTGLKFARGVAIRDGIAYVTGRDSASFVSISVCIPGKPENLDVLHDPRLLGARGIAFLDHYAVFACGLHPSTDKGTQGIAVVDIADPRRLKLVARLDEKTDPRIVSGGSVKVDESRRLAFVSMYRHDGVMVFDISVPSAPRLRSVFHTKDLEGARGLSLRDGVLFVSGAESKSIVSLDTSDPDALAQLGALQHRDLAGARGNALLADRQVLVISSRSAGKSVLVDVRDVRRMAIHSTAGQHPGLYGACANGDHFAHVSASTGALLIGRVRYSK
jgi:hypothetical protein